MARRIYLEKGLEWHAPEATERSEHSQSGWKMLLKVMFGPLQLVVLFHIVKRLDMSLNEPRQIFHFVFYEHMLQDLLHDC